MKIYTKKGDKGKTSLFGGQKVSKNAARINAYGTVDELNTVIGMAAAHGLSEKCSDFIQTIQPQLFVLGSDLATPVSGKTRIARIGEKEVEFLEKAIDEMEEYLEPLRHFIMPGGSKSGATFHFARTVCRRAERLIVECSQEEEISDFAIQYINRMSDFLFVLARFENHSAGTKETEWIPVP